MAVLRGATVGEFTYIYLHLHYIHYVGPLVVSLGMEGPQIRPCFEGSLGNLLLVYGILNV